MRELSYISNEISEQKEWYGTGSPKYNPEIHFPMLREIFGNCGGVAAFCAKAQISPKTFYAWAKKHPEFKHEYEISLSRGGAIWELLPLEWAKAGVHVSHSYWAMIWRQRYKHSAFHLIKEVGGSATARMKAAWEYLREGWITPKEFNQIASGLARESRIAKVDLQKKTLELVKELGDAAKGMKDEAIKASIEAYTAIMNGTGKVVETNSAFKEEINSCVANRVITLAGVELPNTL